MARGRRTDPRLEMARLLRDLQQHAGIGTREMERYSRRHSRGLARTTVSKLTSEDSPQWPTHEQFEAFVEACLAWAKTAERAMPAHLRDRRALTRRYVELSTQAARQPEQQAVIVPRQLPQAIRGFVGRSRELGELSALLNDEGSVIATIAGSPGVGKTALALHWAHQLSGRFPDGALYVDLRGHEANSQLAPEDALDGFLRAFNVPAENIPPNLDDRAGLYRSLLAQRRILVLLDNAASARQVRPLLPGSSGSLAIVTSRLRLSGLVMSEGAHALAVGLLSPAEARELLGRIVGEARTAAEPQAAADIARMCAHLPLALRIAAERIAVHPHADLADLAAELAVEQRRLSVLEIENVSVRTAFRLSYQDLPEEAAHLFRLLGAHPGPDISAEAAEALIGLGPAETREQLDRLTRAHLLETVGKSRYRCHDLLRVYAKEVLDAEANAAEDRLLAWYLHSAAAAGLAVSPSPHAYRPPLDEPPPGCRPRGFGDHHEALQWCDAERANLLAVIQRAAATGRDTVTWKIASSLLFPCYIGAYIAADWMTILDLALPAVRRSGDPIGEGVIEFSRGLAHRNARRFTEAIRCFEDTAAMWRAAGYRWGEGSVLHKLAEAYMQEGRLDDARELLERALGMAEELGEVWGRGNVLVSLGTLCRVTGKQEQAVDYLRDALTLFRDLHPDQRGRAAALIGIGDVYQSMGRHDLAEDPYRQALALTQEAGCRDLEVQTLHHLGETLAHIGRAGDAERALRDSLAIYEELGDPRADAVRRRLHDGA